MSIPLYLFNLPPEEQTVADEQRTITLVLDRQGQRTVRDLSFLAEFLYDLHHDQPWNAEATKARRCVRRLVQGLEVEEAK